MYPQVSAATAAQAHTRSVRASAAVPNPTRWNAQSGPVASASPAGSRSPAASPAVKAAESVNAVPSTSATGHRYRPPVLTGRDTRGAASMIITSRFRRDCS